MIATLCLMTILLAWFVEGLNTPSRSASHHSLSQHSKSSSYFTKTSSFFTKSGSQRSRTQRRTNSKSKSKSPSDSQSQSQSKSQSKSRSPSQSASLGPCLPYTSNTANFDSCTATTEGTVCSGYCKNALGLITVTCEKGEWLEEGSCVPFSSTTPSIVDDGDVTIYYQGLSSSVATNITFGDFHVSIPALTISSAGNLMVSSSFTLIVNDTLLTPIVSIVVINVTTGLPISVSGLTSKILIVFTFDASSSTTTTTTTTSTVTIAPACAYFDEDQSEWVIDTTLTTTFQADTVTCASTHLTMFALVNQTTSVPIPDEKDEECLGPKSTCIGGLGRGERIGIAVGVVIFIAICVGFSVRYCRGGDSGSGGGKSSSGKKNMPMNVVKSRSQPTNLNFEPDV